MGPRTATRQAMVAQCSPSPTKAEGPAARRRISMRRKPAHPDAEGIADDGGNENGENQRPAAIAAKEIHRVRSDGPKRGCTEDRVDMHRLKDVADRAKNRRGKQIADVCEGP